MHKAFFDAGAGLGGDAELTEAEATAVTAAQADYDETEVLAAAVRAERDRLLAECDWTQLADAPLTTEEKSAWAVYRQALRDVPQKTGFPWVVDWPE